MTRGYETSYNTVKTGLYKTIASPLSETCRQNVRLQKLIISYTNKYTFNVDNLNMNRITQQLKTFSRPI